MYRGWMGNDYDDRPDIEFMDRLVEREMEEEAERREDARADEFHDKLDLF